MYTAARDGTPGPSIGSEARSETSPTRRIPERCNRRRSDDSSAPSRRHHLTSLTRNGDELGGTAQVSWNCIRPSAEYFTPIAGAAVTFVVGTSCTSRQHASRMGWSRSALRCSRYRRLELFHSINQQALEKRAVRPYTARPGMVVSGGAAHTIAKENRSTQPAGGSPFSLLSSRKNGPGSPARARHSATGVSVMAGPGIRARAGSTPPASV